MQFMRNNIRRRRARLIEHVLLLLAIAGWTIWFLTDSWRVSAKLENLMLIVPGAALTLGLCVFIGVRAMLDSPREDGAHESFAPLAGDLRTIGFIALFAAFIAGLAWGWFDLSAFVFLFASLLLLGERNVPAAFAYSAVFAAFSTYALSEMVPYDVPALLF
jgi:putative tricarboxylic transport membrane protein